MPLLRKIVWLLVFAALVFRVSAADAAAYRAAVAAGQSLLEKGDYAGAFQQFQRALAADPAQTEVYFLLGVASYRQGNLAAAEEYAKQALIRTPEAEQPRIQEMLKVIEEKRAFERLVNEADEAAGGGLMAKAAESYRKAYLLFPRQGKVGLRAAEIYAGSLNKPLEAAALWQKVQAEDPENAAAAREELVRRRGELNRVIDAQFEAAQKSGNAEALLKLVEVAPERLDLRFELAAVFAARNDAEKAIKHLAEANKLGLKVDALMQRQAFLDLITSEEQGVPFATFIDAAFGADAVTGMREEKKRADIAMREQKIRTDREAKAEEERRAQAEKIVRLEALRSWCADCRIKTIEEINTILTAGDNGVLTARLREVDETIPGTYYGSSRLKFVGLPLKSEEGSYSTGYEVEQSAKEIRRRKRETYTDYDKFMFSQVNLAAVQNVSLVDVAAGDFKFDTGSTALEEVVREESTSGLCWIILEAQHAFGKESYWASRYNETPAIWDTARVQIPSVIAKAELREQVKGLFLRLANLERAALGSVDDLQAFKEQVDREIRAATR
jgi:tetratricopeptide (TPR) repeat protein